jgi:hypothetical protein
MGLRRAPKSVAAQAMPVVVTLVLIAGVVGAAAWLRSGRDPGVPEAAASDRQPSPVVVPAASTGPSTPVVSAFASPSATAGRTAAASRNTVRPSPSPPVPAGQTRGFYITFYSAVDNDPPGSRAIAYPVIHSQADGTGTYRDPVTLATSKAELAAGTIIYYAHLKRYFIMEDLCVSCEQEWKDDRSPHLDLWTGASLNPGILACENALTRDGQVPVIVNPPPTLPVDTTPLYDGRRCYRP